MKRESYPGGKGNLYKQIINLIPPHNVYIEPFAGGGTVLKQKKPAMANIAIERDASVLDRLTADIIKKSDKNSYQFVEGDALAWLKKYPFKGDEFIYADPPYMLATRRQKRALYTYEMSDQDHLTLLKILKGLNCKVMVSSYGSTLYAQELANWHLKKYEVMTRGGSKAMEYLWMNYPQPEALHQYTHLGETFRERERIKRKRKRWLANFRALPILEQKAILVEIERQKCFTEKSREKCATIVQPRETS